MTVSAGIRLEILPVPGLPEVGEGDDIAALVVAVGAAIEPGDILVVSSKIVSKSEGRVARGVDRNELIDKESVATVASRDKTRIVRTRHGFVMAAAGVDASNTEPGTLVLLPEDSDASARRIRSRTREITGAAVAVIVTDTFGRPWRNGVIDAAVGVAGLVPLIDLRGRKDRYGNQLHLTLVAVADELAAAADLVKGKLSHTPVVIVRGLAHLVVGDDGPGVGPLLRNPDEDMFRLGAREAAREAVMARRTVRTFRSDPVDLRAVRRAVAAAVTAPAPHHSMPWRFVVVADEEIRAELLEAMRDAWIADLQRDGFDWKSIERRVRRGDVLRNAPLLVVPALVPDDAHSYPDLRRSTAERSMFLVAMGAGVQNFLVALAAEHLGTAWVSSTLFCPEVAQKVLGLPDTWQPMGTVAVGQPLGQAPPRPNRAIDDFLLLC